MTRFQLLWQAADDARQQGDKEKAAQLFRKALSEINMLYLLEKLPRARNRARRMTCAKHRPDDPT